MNWIEYIVVGMIIFFGFFALYKGLKEPLDALGRVIRSIFLSIKERASNRDVGGYEVIEYG